MIYRCPGGRERALSPCGCDVRILLTYCLVTKEPGKPQGVGLAAPVQQHRAFAWDVGAAHSGFWQREQLGVLWDGCGCSRGGLSLQRVDLISCKLHLARDGWGEWGGWSDSLSSLPLPASFGAGSTLLQRSRGYGWCGCVCVFTSLSCSGISSWGHLGSRKGRK